MLLVPAPSPISFVPAAFLSLHWCGDGGFAKSEGREKYFNVPVWITVWNVLWFLLTIQTF